MTPKPPTQLNGAAAAMADAYEFALPDGRILQCRVPTLAEVSRITALQFQIERGRFSTDEQLVREAEQANLQLYELLPQALGLDPNAIRLLPREVGRLAADFFARSRFPLRSEDGEPIPSTAQALPAPTAAPDPDAGPAPAPGSSS